MNFVDDVNFITEACRGVLDVFAQFSYLVDAPVGGAVNFQNIHTARCGDFDARRTLVTGRGCWFIKGKTVEAFCQYARGCGLTNTAWPAEEIGVGKAIEFNGTGQGVTDMVLNKKFSKKFAAGTSGLKLYEWTSGGDESGRARILAQTMRGV